MIILCSRRPDRQEPVAHLLQHYDLSLTGPGPRTVPIPAFKSPGPMQDRLRAKNALCSAGAAPADGVSSALMLQWSAGTLSGPFWIPACPPGSRDPRPWPRHAGQILASQEAMTTGDPLRALPVGVHVMIGAAAGGAVPCRVIGGTGA